MDEVPDDTEIDNPSRVVGRAKRKTAAVALAAAKVALGAESAHPRRPICVHLAALRALQDDVAMAEDDLEEATTVLTAIPARLPRNEVCPGATRCRPRLERRALQMVCRLLAYNAELDLSRRLNAYLGDDDDYRAITRNPPALRRCDRLSATRDQCAPRPPGATSSRTNSRASHRGDQPRATSPSWRRPTRHLRPREPARLIWDRPPISGRWCQTTVTSSSAVGCRLSGSS
jgi:hypothetical protein